MLRRAAAADMNGSGSVDDRFERRLVEETSKLRVELAAVEVRLAGRVAQFESALRQDLGALELRMERSLGAVRCDLVKWSFVFWIGQIAVMTAIMSALLRAA
jgi:hypothetical protein